MPSRFAIVLAALWLCAATPPVWAAEMQLMGTEPRANQVMSGSGVAFALHFDHPLDHEASHFMLTGGSGVRLTLPVRLGAQPNVLYGSVGRLSPGSYTLNWTARSSDGAELSGDLPFVIRPRQWRSHNSR